LEAERVSGERGGARERLLGASGAAVSDTVPAGWADFVISRLGTPAGRVLHAEAGDGELVRRLVDAGFDAYGVEPSEEAALAASDLVPDIRAVDAIDHLRTLPPDSLSGLILSGFIERLDLGSLVGLAEQAASRLAPGGRLVVVSAHPRAWWHYGPPLAVDLAPGRPWYPETWEALLRGAGFADPTVQLGARPQLAPVADSAANENFARLAEAVFGPTDYAVSAHQPR
jgi:SAM-dependent methyltransferase